MNISNPVFLIGVLLFSLICIAIYIVKSYSFYTLAKKFNSCNAYLTWIPIMHTCFRYYVIGNISKNKRFYINKKISKTLTLSDKSTAFIAYASISALGYGFCLMALGIYNLINNTKKVNEAGDISLFNIFAIALVIIFITLAVKLVLSVFHYVYVRDVLSMFSTNKTANEKTALKLVVIDYFTFGCAIPIYFLTVKNQKPVIFYNT